MRSVLAGMVAAVLLAGCGAALAQPGTGRQPRTAAVVTGSRAQAQAYVQHAMAELSLPAGTVPAHLKVLPEIMRDRAPGPTGWASASRILIVPGQPLAVLKRISGHAPFNQPVIYSAIPVQNVTLLPAPEPGLDAAVLDLTVEAYSRTATLVGAYADAAWLPYRTAAENLNPAMFSAVTIVKHQLIGKPGAVSRSFTSAAVIGRFTTFLNGRAAAPLSAFGWMSCPPPIVTYALRFTPRYKGGPVVTTSSGCGTVTINVNGKQQPFLWDTNGGLETIASAVLGKG
jgi:uncharacterized protein YceK